MNNKYSFVYLLLAEVHALFMVILKNDHSNVILMISFLCGVIYYKEK